MKDKRMADAGEDNKKKKELDTRRDLRMSALGSGSDYTVFLDHLTVASANLAFRGAGGGVYHSIYDSFDWYRRFGDPEFVYGRTLAQFNAMVLTRLAGAEVIPFEFTNLADTIGVYLDELDELLEEKRKKDPGVALELKPLKSGRKKISEAAKAYEAVYEQAFSGDGPTGDLSKVNRALRKVEQAMRRPEGLPGEREWYQHALYAPGFYTGYGVKTIPGVRESMEQDDWSTAKAQVGVMEEVFAAIADQIAEAEKELWAVR
jgi:N-acetylated-alpha-linked acidic dipeptidase